ncbi:MAG TPA: SRPBCC family protein [Anaerolineales bacterium]|nr:SRPBCC family protein [Anaerolineales bacterium]
MFVAHDCKKNRPAPLRPRARRVAGDDPKGDVIMSTNTVRLHRVFRAPAERIYRAFLDADAMAKWLPPNGFTGKVYHVDAKVGGTYKMSFTNFNTGHRHSFGGKYLELVPHERIRHTDIFDDPGLPGEMQTTISLKKVFCGTEVDIVQEGIPEVIPTEACYLGWQESLALLAQLVEAEIPDS